MSASSLSDGLDRSGLLQQPSKEHRQQRLRDALERADAQNGRPVVSRAVQIRARGAQPCVDHLRVVEQQLPSGVIATLREPRSRVTSRAPTSRSSVAICPLIADWL